jgi:arylsulfatase A-like enzyme
MFAASALDRWTPLQRAFKRAGYYTFTTGKRHLLHKLDTDWDYAAGDLKSEAHDTLNYWDWVKAKGLTNQAKADFEVELGGPEHAAHFGCKISQLPPQATMEAFAAEQTIQFLKSPSAKQKPFFAWSTFYRPHQPYTPLQTYVDQIDFAGLRLPPTLRQNANELPPLVQNLRHRTTRPWDLASGDEASFRRYIGYYHALVREVDHHIGSILETLEQEGLAENTIVIYASDHGDFVGGHGLIEKAAAAQCYYEEVLRVPLLFHWPGKIASGQACPELVELVDLYPTIMELCELPLPPGLAFPGRSLAPTLLRQAPIGRKYVVAENWGQTTVIAADYKYGQWVNSPLSKYAERTFGNLLMQRSTDPGEVKNLIAERTATAALRQMQGYLAEWLTKTDDTGRREFVAAKCKGTAYQPI